MLQTQEHLAEQLCQRSSVVLSVQLGFTFLSFSDERQLLTYTVAARPKPRAVVTLASVATLAQAPLSITMMITAVEATDNVLPTHAQQARDRQCSAWSNGLTQLGATTVPTTAIEQWNN